MSAYRGKIEVKARCLNSGVMEVEEYLDFGIPLRLAYIKDGLEECYPDAKQWHKRFLYAIQPGSDLDMVAWKYLAWQFTHTRHQHDIKRVQATCNEAGEILGLLAGVGPQGLPSIFAPIVDNLAAELESIAQSVPETRSATTARSICYALKSIHEESYARCSVQQANIGCTKWGHPFYCEATDKLVELLHEAPLER